MEILNKLNFYSFNSARDIGEIDFNELEKIIQREIPLSYKLFYRNSNGGRIKENLFFKSPEDKFEAFAVNDFYHLVADEKEDKFETNVFTIIKKNLFGNVMFVPWGFDGSNNQLYLDFNNDEPKVYAYYYDEDDTGIPKQVFLANSIEDFLKGLREYEEE